MKSASLQARPSCRRIALLVALGVTMGVAFTAPGHWYRARFARRALYAARMDVSFPRWLEQASGEASRQLAALRAVRDMDYNSEDPFAARRLPTPTEISRRLEGIDGWSTAALFELGSSVGDLRDAGLPDTTACVLIAGPLQGRRFAPYWQPIEDPIRQWTLVLLDDSGRQVARVWLSALSPGFALAEGRGFVREEGAPGDGELPSVCVFRRTSTGDVRTG
jgi:hypothetical protein